MSEYDDDLVVMDYVTERRPDMHPLRIAFEVRWNDTIGEVIERTMDWSRAHNYSGGFSATDRIELRLHRPRPRS